MKKLLMWFLGLFEKKDKQLDPNLLRGYWIFNVDEKEIKIISDKNFSKELKENGVKIFDEIVIPPNRYGYIPYKLVEYIVDGEVKAHMALDRRTKVKYASRFNCKPISQLRLA